jgi:hypothetical protein
MAEVPKVIIMLAVKANFDLSGLQRAARAFGAEQIPFAQALALTRLAQGVSADEAQTVRETFDNPTPFTQKSFSVTPATKKTPIAYVRAKDIAARYLAPYVFGGERSLGSKKAMLVPRNVALNQYGNLSRNKLATLRGKQNVFIGQVKTKKGKTISGVWQRPVAAPTKARKGAPAAASGLTLLIQFEDTTPAPKHLPFHERAQAYVAKHAKDEFTAALRQAFDTARRGRRR